MIREAQAENTFMSRRWIQLVIVFAAVLLIGCRGGTASSPDGLLGVFSSPSPAQVARQAFNRYDADQRRRSVLLIANAPWGGQTPYLQMYRMLLHDPDPTVRAAALRALGMHGKASDVPRIVPYLDDPSALVRWEAARALQRLHHQAAIEPLIATLREDPDPDVRVAAADALAQYPKRKVFRALVGALTDPSYAVASQARQSLVTLTSKDFGTHTDDWLAWARDREKLFVHRQPYSYPRYGEPTSLWDRLTFWTSPEPAPPRPRS